MASRGCKCAFCDAYRNQTSKTPSNSSLGDLSTDPMADTAVRALAYWDTAVSHGDEGPEEFAAVLEAAEQIRDSGGPRAEDASKAIEQFDAALAKAADVDKDIPVDDEQAVIDVVRGYVEDREANGSVPANDFTPAAPPVPDDWEITGDERRTIRDQIGMMNVLAISGGKITPLKDGIELPVGRGYRVRVRLTPVDDYTVERVFVRGGKEWSYGKRDGIYADEVGNMAYWASCYNNDSGKEWTYMGR